MFLIPIEKDNPSQKFPLCVTGLIIVNVVIFAASYLLFEHSEFVKEYGFTPSSYSHLTVFSSMFLHAGVWHILGNMFFLYMYGDNVEEVLGSDLFLFAYLLCGLGGTALHYFFNADSQIPCIGASGAISGIVGLYMLFYPNAHVDIDFYIGHWSIGEIHAKALGAILTWFGWQTFLGLLIYFISELQVIRIAFWAHVGGLAAGFFLGFILKSLGVEASVPKKEYNITRKTAGNFWCPHCGKEYPRLNFGHYTCDSCGAKYHFEKEEIE